MVYKVNIEEGADETREGEVREQSLKGTRKGQAAIANATIMAASRDDKQRDKLAAAAQERESAAATLKEKKTMKEAAAAAKNLLTEFKKGKAVAIKCFGLATSVHAALEKAIKHRRDNPRPTMARLSSAEAALELVLEVQQNAYSCINTGEPFLFSTVEVSNIIDAAVKKTESVEGM